MDRWMKEITSKISRLLFDDEGATATEYAVIVAAILLAVLAVVLFLEELSKGVFNGVGSKAGTFGTID